MSNPNPKVAGRRGGLAKTPAKMAALMRLHESRRGRRVNVTSGNLREKTLSDLREILNKHRRNGVISIRVLADFVGVDDRTIRRWLNGSQWPDTSSLQAIASWVRKKLEETK